MSVYADDPRPFFTELGLWAGTRKYDLHAREWLAKSGHYLDAPPPGAIMTAAIERMVPGLFGPVPGGDIVGLALLGRPVARNLPQDGSVGELTRFVLDPSLPKGTASHFLRVAFECWFQRDGAVAAITYHDRTRHTGCIYKKAGMRKDGVTRAGTRRGTWSSRPGREQAASSEEPSKRRWRIARADVLPFLLSRLDRPDSMVP